MSAEEIVEQEEQIETPNVGHEEEANNMVKNYIIASMGAALVPVPLFDMVALTGIQLKMLHSLAKLYDVKFTKNLGKSLIGSLLGGIVPTSTAASLSKAVPGVGTTAGVIGMSAIGGAATYAIGRVFIQHFESGGTFLDFNPEKVREYFKAEFERGKDVANELQDSDEVKAEAEKATA
ncbi:YcjF family protein [Candidatus Albibeggiatoa sp. nov. NOAA]|uniref:YcjF family protein n=1 Tax=Candidatus Albibeggiatoa sp. nov. NOAA TaxID=3162724 RepID=UPI0032F1EAC4|nr:YcjF family protein [Thiotrichaceae bacterium]